MFRLSRSVHQPLPQRLVGAQQHQRRHKASTSTTTTSSAIDPLSDDYQYLQRSQTPMLHFQPSLLRLPIPDLNKTCDRYLAAQRALSDDPTGAAFEHTRELVERFRNADGPPLQTLLRDTDRANKHTSYISAPWFDAYLADRRPLPINYNVSLIMKPDERPAYNGQLVRTTNLVVSALRFRRSLREHVLKPEVYHMNAKKSDTESYHRWTRLAPARVSTFVSMAFGAYPLDMSQYGGLFGATRVPCEGRDELRREGGESRHVVVLREGHLFAVDVLDGEGRIEAPHVVQARLRHIIEQPLTAAEHPIGALTSAERNTWAAARQHLTATGNTAALRLIDDALFCVCLDADRIDPDDPVPMVLAQSAGDGTNRWFDKSISLMVGGDGTAAVHFEHSWGDGVAVLRFFNEIYADSQAQPSVQPGEEAAASQVDVTGTVRPIAFQLDDRSRADIRAARDAHAQVMRSLAMHTCIYHGMNKRICKEFKLSPDSVMQLGFQLAFYKQTGTFGSTYESCSTAAFRHGRTETIRPCTVATRRFCEAVTARERPSRAELRSMIDECSRVHGALTKEAAMGQGFDRHLFGLRHAALGAGMPVPELYADEAYRRINHNVMSTSTLSSPGLLVGAFGPVVADGYGIGYSIQDDMMGAIVSSYPAHRSGPEFVECLKEAYEAINKVVVT